MKWTKRNTNKQEPIREELAAFGELEQWSEQHWRTLFADSHDVQIKSLRIGENLHVVLLYIEGMTNTNRLNDYVLPRLSSDLAKPDVSPDLYEQDPTLDMSPVHNALQLSHSFYDGSLIVLVENWHVCYALKICDVPKRNPEESNTEISIKGARDGFTEEIQTNVALIRKRLRTPSLNNELFRIGRRSQTRVALLYLRDVANPDLIAEARRRLEKIDVDVLTTSAELEEGLSDFSLSLFPLVDYIGRPDFVTAALARGRFAVIVDGSPMALIAPSGLTEQLKSPEDMYLPFMYVTLERVLRGFGLFISVMLPGFWVALCAFDMDQLPFPLLATVSNTRQGLPLSAPIEGFLTLGLFEIFREAGTRLPKAVGQTIAVVGGLIVGDAAIRAGLTSPSMLVIMASTAVATFTLINQSLAGAVSILRLFVLIMGSTLGVYGVMIGFMACIAYMSRLTSFGIPYLAPLSPVHWKGLTAALFSLPWRRRNIRPDSLKPIDPTRQGEDSA